MASKIKGKDKYYFEAFKEEGKPPGSATDIKFAVCSHKKARIIDDTLVCPCGAFWQGPRIKELEKQLKGVL